jgi:hypothetical protein
LHCLLELRAAAGQSAHARSLSQARDKRVATSNHAGDNRRDPGNFSKSTSASWPGDPIVPRNFLKIRNTIDDPMSENRIAFVKQMKPISLINAADLVVEMRGFEERICDLRTEGH